MKKRELKKKMRNGFLWTATYIAFILLLISASAFESESCLPAVAFIVSLAWLTLFSISNKGRW